MMRKIDIEQWERRPYYELFTKFAQPQYSITANVDISKLYQQTQGQRLPFYPYMVYWVTKTINSILEFKYRRIGDEVFEFDIIHPSCTIAREDGYFDFCDTQYSPDLNHFIAQFQQRVEVVCQQEPLKASKKLELDRVYISSIPWVTFTSFNNPFFDPSKDSVPRVVWGKYFQQNERWLLPISIEVNHAFIDGVHLGKFFTTLQANLDDCAGLMSVNIAKPASQ